jgi:hypothetical protein
MDAGAEGSSGAEWLHGHLHRYGDVFIYLLYINLFILIQYVNQR